MKGWGAQDDFQEQIEQSIRDAREVATASLKVPGRIICEDCEKKIPEARREAYPSATRCIKCQEIFEA